MGVTADLLAVKTLNASKKQIVLREVNDRLLEQHGEPTLGNFRDPVKEIFYILLSARTTDAQYRATHRALWTAYPKLTELARAKVADVRKCIKSGGLFAIRARQVVKTARKILALAKGKNPSRWIRSLNDHEAYNFLTGLSGIGSKSAFCVMMYSLNRDTFPVDINVQRIAERLGVVKRGIEHWRAQRELARIVPEGVAKTLHVGMVVHGRKVCLPLKPKCDECCLNDICKRGRKELTTHGAQKE